MEIQARDGNNLERGGMVSKEEKEEERDEVSMHNWAKDLEKKENVPSHCVYIASIRTCNIIILLMIVLGRMMITRR